MSGDIERDEQDYLQAADWAETDMALKPESRTALRGPAAAEHGRALLERATGGRPPLDPDAAPGQHSPVRQVRLPADLNEQLDAVAAAEHRRPSDVIRSALAEYLANRSAG
ncbi:MAG: ribbon-helix-helix protein, CopG family [Sporichthyaceae bacterium]